MSYAVTQPAAALRPYIRHLAIARSDVASQYAVLPDTALVIGFQWSGGLSHLKGATEEKLNASGITGILDSYRVFQNSANTGTVLVVFTETGAAHFLRTPIHELFGHSLSLEHFFSTADIRETQEKLMAANTDSERLRVVERFLLAQWKDREADRLVAEALYHIHQSKGTIRIAALAELLHTSQSPLEKRFRAIVGASPKKFAGIVRAQHMLQALRNVDQQAADHLGSYYDQAHFIKDFKKFSSFTPEQYLKLIREQRK